MSEESTRAERFAEYRRIIEEEIRNFDADAALIEARSNFHVCWCTGACRLPDGSKGECPSITKARRYREMPDDEAKAELTAEFTRRKRSLLDTMEHPSKPAKFVHREGIPYTDNLDVKGLSKLPSSAVFLRPYPGTTIDRGKLN